MTHDCIASPPQGSELCLLANSFGPLESVKIRLDKAIAFLNFLEEADAVDFYECCQTQAPYIGNRHIFVNPAKPPNAEAWIKEAVANGATRNLFMTNYGPVRLDDVRGLFSNFCEVLDIVVKPNYTFIHTSSIRGAVIAKNHLDGFIIGGRKIVLNFAQEKVGPNPPSFSPAAAIEYRVVSPSLWCSPPPAHLPSFSRVVVSQSGPQARSGQSPIHVYPSPPTLLLQNASEEAGAASGAYPKSARFKLRRSHHRGRDQITVCF